MRIRKDLLKLEKKELQDLNDGFEALVAHEGFGGYQHIAGVYGKPGRPYGVTTPELFLPWHRAYLMAFERMLDRVWPGLTLAYWDWTEESACVRGIPGRLKKVAYSDHDQGVWLNQFCRAPIDCIDHEYFTERKPGKPAGLRPLTEKVRGASSETTFEGFAATLAEASLGFRGWVGGHLKDEDYAAYDPLFWFHHANLDRIWARWQKARPDAHVPDALLDTVLEPFNLRVRDILSLDRLAYGYDDAVS